MPHINRVRVNNVRYNFGTQFYDDFIMRFDCKNVLYDLANGGGKSVLLLLLLHQRISLQENQYKYRYKYVQSHNYVPLPYYPYNSVQKL